MESNFFSGSENLYKYLVSIGILMLVLAIYYPLKQKQDLEILKLNLVSEVTILNIEIKDNKKNVDFLKSNIKNKAISINEKKKYLIDIKDNQRKNEINQSKSVSKIGEIESRTYYIKLYNNLFWIATIIGLALISFGFVRWISAKRNEDKKLDLETKILEIKYKNDKEDYDNAHS